MDNSFIIDNFKGGGIYSFVGGGGKTSLIKEGADRLSKAGYQVIITTTTKLGKEEFKDYTIKVLKEFNNLLKDEGKKNRIKVLISEIGEKKLIGFKKEELEKIDFIPLNQIILVEADGSRRMPVKVPYGYEPVIPANTGKLFLVFGASALGETIREANTYNLDNVKDCLLGETKYTPGVFKSLIEKKWLGILKDFNSFIFFNQGDKLENRQELAEVSDYFKKEYGIFGSIGSVLEKKIYHSNILRLGCLILAAGEGKRIRLAKQLLRYKKESFLEAAIKKYNSFAFKTIVTLGYHKEDIKKEIEEIGFKFKEIEGYREGMGSSFRESYREFSRVEALLVTPCDLPLIKEETIKKIIAAFIQNPHKTILPKYEGKKGHPVLFSFEDLKLFAKIKGDEGGRSILKELDLLELSLDDPGIIADIDTRIEYLKLKEK